MIAALFQKASELGVPQMPVSKTSTAAAAVNNASRATLESGLRSADQAGARLVKKYPSNNKAVSRKRPLVLVYSPRTTIVTTINTATTKNNMNPIPYDLGVIIQLRFTPIREMLIYSSNFKASRPLDENRSGTVRAHYNQAHAGTRRRGIRIKRESLIEPSG